MRTTGFLLIICSLVLFVVDRGTQLLSGALGKIACGKNYLQPVNGVVGDGSCGFNTDMYLAAILALLGLVGMLLIGLSYRKTNSH